MIVIGSISIEREFHFRLRHQRDRLRRSVSDLVLTRLAWQAKDSASLGRGGDRAIQFMRDPNRSLYKLSVAFGFLSSGIVDIVFQADSNVAAHQGGERGQRELKWTNR